MPSTISWRGDAIVVAQVDTLTVGGTVEVGDLFIITVGNKTLTVAAGSTTPADVADAIVAAWASLTQAVAPEFYEIIPAEGTSGTLTLTARTAGKPFTVSVSTTESNGDPADDQTFTRSATTTNSGPNDFSLAANFSGGVLPTDGDTLVFENNSSSVLYNLDALSAITLASLQIKQSYTGYIGLPKTSGSGTGSYSEYRPDYMEIGATAWSIGSGDGAGTGRIKINFGSVQYAGSIYNSGTAVERGVPSVLILGTHASNVLTVLKGSVGVATFAGEVSTIATLNVGYVSSVIGDAIITLGSGVTLTNIIKSGGQITTSSNITSLTQYDGSIEVGGAATIGTAIIGGTIVDMSSGTFGGTSFTLLEKGIYDHGKTLVAKTITNLAMYKGSRYSDPYGTNTLTNGIVLTGCKLSDVTIDIPVGKTIDIS